MQASEKARPDDIKNFNVLFSPHFPYFPVQLGFIQSFSVCTIYFMALKTSHFIRFLYGQNLDFFVEPWNLQRFWSKTAIFESILYFRIFSKLTNDNSKLAPKNLCSRNLRSLSPKFRMFRTKNFKHENFKLKKLIINNTNVIQVQLENEIETGSAEI